MGLFSSKSTSSNATTNNQIDQKLMLEQGAVGATASGGGTATVNMIDAGAISAAFGMGEYALKNVTDFATGALSGAHHTTERALNGALASVDQSRSAYQDATKEVAKAYEDAKVGNRSTIMLGVIALGAVALVLIARRKGAN